MSKILKSQIVALFITFCYAGAWASSTSCLAPTTLIPDGRTLDFDVIQPSTTVWYWFTASANRSYSVEIRDDIDGDSGDLAVAFYGPGGACGSLVSPSTTDTHNTDPVITTGVTPPPISRFSFITNATGNGIYRLSVQNKSTTASHYLSVTVTETTLYTWNWSTYSNFYTQFEFFNSTTQAIHYTFILTAFGGTQTVTTSGSINSFANGSFFTNASPLNLAAQQSGYATFAHDGPPGSIQVVVFDVGPNGGPFVPVPMVPIRGK